MNDKIEIVGAGPAGLVASINLARAGYRVTVYEKNPDVGYRFNGDFQGLENWTSDDGIASYLDSIGIRSNFLFHPYYGGDLYGPDHRRIEISSEKSIFYLVKRGSEPESLDQGLKEQALEAGVKILFDRKVKNVDGRAIIGAGPKSADAFAAGMLFDTNHEDMAAVIFDNNLAPDGYAYLLINSGRGTIASCMFRDFNNHKRYLGATLHTFLRLYGLKVNNEKIFGGFGNFFINDSFQRKGKMYVGEAAGFQDYLWGFGMKYAMTSGYLAAKSIINREDYDSLCRETLVPHLKSSLINRYVFRIAGNMGYKRLVSYIRRSGDVRGFLMKYYKPSFYKGLIFPLARIKYKSRLKKQFCEDENCLCVGYCRSSLAKVDS